jgi:hypothetical protein
MSADRSLERPVPFDITQASQTAGSVEGALLERQLQKIDSRGEAI